MLGYLVEMLERNTKDGGGGKLARRMEEIILGKKNSIHTTVTQWRRPGFLHISQWKTITKTATIYHTTDTNGSN